jgi:hypothetical protein
LKDCSKEKREHRTDACVPQSLTQFSFIEKALLTSAMNKKKKKNTCHKDMSSFIKRMKLQSVISN